MALYFYGRLRELYRTSLAVKVCGANAYFLSPQIARTREKTLSQELSEHGAKTNSRTKCLKIASILGDIE